MKVKFFDTYFSYKCVYNAFIFPHVCVQVSRAAVEGYTGEGKPPCIVMTLRAVSDETVPPNLSLLVTLTGVRKQSKELQIYRPAEGNITLTGGF